MYGVGARRAQIKRQAAYIAGLVDVLTNNLDDGKSVQLGEFGTFRPGIRAKAASTEEDVSAENIYRKRIIFTPGTALKDVMSKVSVTRFTTPDTDYTKSNSNNSGGNDDEGDIDPSA